LAKATTRKPVEQSGEPTGLLGSQAIDACHAAPHWATNPMIPQATCPRSPNLLLACARRNRSAPARGAKSRAGRQQTRPIRAQKAWRMAEQSTKSLCAKGILLRQRDRQWRSSLAEQPKSFSERELLLRQGGAPVGAGSGGRAHLGPCAPPRPLVCPNA
jgi:hypothetical protein